jgi:glycosyltransferase involved in cell wall biosynthesis
VGGPGILGYGKGVKLYTAHEHWLVCSSHILWRHNRELCDARECLRCVLNHKRPPQLWRATNLLQRQSRHVDAFLTYSQFCADKHSELGFDRPMQVIPPFLPDSELAGSDGFEEDVDAAENPYFLFVGRLEEIKGLQDAIPHFRDGALGQLRIAGTGNFEPALRKIAADSPHVRFLGHQDMRSLRRLYLNALAVLAPSRCYEVFPMVVLEAFREGTPVVARKLGPFPEIMEASGGGVLFDNAEQLRAALLKIKKDRRYREVLGRAAKAAYDTRWSEKAAMSRYFGLIDTLMQQRTKPSVHGRPRHQAA